MRKVLLIGAATAAMLTLSACSESGGEDELFFDRTPALTRLVLDACQSDPAPAGDTFARGDEDNNPFTILNSSFGNFQQAVPENTDPADSTFTSTCIEAEDNPSQF